MNAVDILNLPHPQKNFSIHTLRKHHPTDCQIDPKHYGFHVKRFTIKEHKNPKFAVLLVILQFPDPRSHQYKIKVIQLNSN